MTITRTSSKLRLWVPTLENEESGPEEAKQFYRELAAAAMLERMGSGMTRRNNSPLYTKIFPVLGWARRRETAMCSA